MNKEPLKPAVFLLSPRIIDFDTYMPVAMELVERGSVSSVHFVTFSRRNYETLVRNITLMSALDAIGTLALAGDPEGNLFERSLGRGLNFLRISFQICRSGGLLLVHGRQYGQWPYFVWYLLNRVLGGVSLTMARIRIPDEGHHPHRRAEFVIDRPSLALLRRLTGRDTDGLVYFHDRQEMYLDSLARYGATDWPTKIKIGIPNLLPAWVCHIDRETENYRRELKESGVSCDEVYSFFSAKGYSSANLASPDSSQRTCALILKTFLSARPDATILLRPHPIALEEPWFKDVLASIDDSRIILCDAHPEVMLALSRASVINSPTNIAFTATKGFILDCSDYRADYLEQTGGVSLANGYGATWIDPNRLDFADAFSKGLSGDGVDVQKRERLMSANNPDIRPLQDWANV